MYSYIIGEIVEINVDHIVVENNGIGYLIYVSNSYEFTKGKEIKVYVISICEKKMYYYCMGLKLLKKKKCF
ncbi:MAG: OB-fold domain-containing protein [Thomasclavelia sp.]